VVVKKKVNKEKREEINFFSYSKVKEAKEG